MSPLLLGILLVLGGLLMAKLSPGAKPAVVAQVVFWLGIIIVIVGVLLILIPPLNWLAAQLKSAMNV